MRKYVPRHRIADSTSEDEEEPPQRRRRIDPTINITRKTYFPKHFRT